MFFAFWKFGSVFSDQTSITFNVVDAAVATIADAPIPRLMPVAIVSAVAPVAPIISRKPAIKGTSATPPEAITPATAAIAPITRRAISTSFLCS